MTPVTPRTVALFDADVWGPALEKFAAATQLTVTVYAEVGQLACGPFLPTPIFHFFTTHGYDPGLFDDCVRRCLERTDRRPAVVVAARHGLAVVGTSLVLDGRVVGAAVGGYTLVDFSRRPEIERLALAAGVEFDQLWAVARQNAPMPSRRLRLNGELLQVLGDTILREGSRTRQYEDTALQLIAAAAAKDEFLAVLSHELRTPLTPILGWASILKLGDPGKMKRAAEVIEKNALLQVRLVEDLLELTRLTRSSIVIDLKVCDIGEALCAASEPFSGSALEKGVEFRVVPPPHTVLIKADPNRLQQVFRNILSNALKFTPVGGSVDAAVTTDLGWAVVTFVDTGEGIAPAFLPFAFEMFQQQEHGTRRSHEGLGIGLALVKRLTELQQGEVSIASEGSGCGVRVTLRFPLLVDAVVPAADPARAIVRKGTLSGLRVLIVEDMDDAREFTRLMLEDLGADVICAADGLEALKVMERCNRDVILCDLRMPRMDGFEFMRAIHRDSATRPPPVIALSGLASSADHLRTQAAGFVGHLDKPFDDVRLLAAIGAAVGHHP